MNESSIPTIPQSLLCPVCHQPLQPEFYFCPNCGKSLKEKPPSTSAGAQIGLYLMSIITPLLCFITIGSWHGMKYFKSEDPHAKQIGIISIILMIISTVVTSWFLYVFTLQLMQSLSGGLVGAGGENFNF